MIPIQSNPDFSKEEPWWLVPLHGDDVLLHCIIFVAKGYQAFVRGGDGRADKDLLLHYVQTIALLQRRLAAGDEKMSTSDATTHAGKRWVRSGCFCEAVV